MRLAPILAEYCEVSPKYLSIPSYTKMPLFNPTVVLHRDQYIFISKACNILGRNDGRATQLSSEYESKPVMHIFDEKLDVASDVLVNDTKVREKSKLAKDGLGDLRLFLYGDAVWGLGSGVSGGASKQILYRFERENIVDFVEFELACPASRYQFLS